MAAVNKIDSENLISNPIDENKKDLKDTEINELYDIMYEHLFQRKAWHRDSLPELESFGWPS